MKFQQLHYFTDYYSVSYFFSGKIIPQFLFFKSILLLLINIKIFFDKISKISYILKSVNAETSKNKP